MVKFTATNRDNGTTVIGLGLEAGNIERLKAGQPILVDLRDLGFTLPLEVLIFYGKDLETMKATLEPMIDRKRTVVVDESAAPKVAP